MIVFMIVALLSVSGVALSRFGSDTGRDGLISVGLGICGVSLIIAIINLAVPISLNLSGS